MSEFIGSKIVDIKHSPYKRFSRNDWVMLHIERYGQIDGAHHKQWLLDQIARIIKGAPITVTLSEWGDGTKEYSFEVGSSDKYSQWVDDMRGDWDEEEDSYEYNYDTGIAP